MIERLKHMWRGPMYASALRQIASMKCPIPYGCGAYNRGDCQAGCARMALRGEWSTEAERW